MSAQLWTAFEAAAATGGALCSRGGDPDRWVAEEWAAGGVSIDTRSLRRGEIFVALNDVRDGHEFLKSAFDAGASAALVSRAPKDAPDGAPLLLVGDTLEGLRDLARAARIRNFGRRIAVTGSAGKTSTKEILRTILAPSGEVHAADKSFNNHWGVPLTLAKLPMNADYGVFEIGMNHSGEITPLTQLVAPHAVIITTVAAAHLEFFKNVEEIAEAKAEIFRGLAPGGLAILPIDNPHFARLKKRADECNVGRILTFGEGKNADYRLVDYCASGEGADLTTDILGERHEFYFASPGRHQATNALAALAAAHGAGAPLDKSIAALAGHKPPQGRGERTEIALGAGTVQLIDESYNANPASMAASIALLGATPLREGGRRIAVLGQMLELGPDGPALHAALAEALAAAKIDRLYAAGELMASLKDAVPAAMMAGFAPSADELTDTVLQDLRDGDVVMVKGSNASKVSEIARALKALAAQQRKRGSF